MRPNNPGSVVLGAPIATIDFATMDAHDLSDGVAFGLLQLRFNAGDYQDALKGSPVAAIVGVAGNRYLDLLPNTDAGVYGTGVAPTAGIFQVLFDLAVEREWQLNQIDTRVTYWQDDSDGADFLGADERFFVGLQTAPASLPGTLASADSMHAFWGADGAGVTDKGIDNIRVNAVTPLLSSAVAWGGITVAEHVWNQREDKGIVRQISATGAKASAVAATTSQRCVFGTAPGSVANQGIRAFFGLSALGTQPRAKIKKIELFAIPGVVA